MITPPHSPALDELDERHAPETIITERLATLRARFIERTCNDAARLQVLVDQRRSDSASAEANRQLTQLAHSLSGSAGLFGFPEISAASALLEAQLRDPGRHDAAIDTAINALQSCLARMLD